MQTREQIFSFAGKMTPPVVGSPGPTPFCVNIVGSQPPTATPGTDGFTLALGSTDQAQNVCLYFGDILSYHINLLKQIEILLAIPVALGAGVTLIAGVGSARNNDPDSLAGGAWFRLDASNAIKCESASGLASDPDDIATGHTLGTAFKRLKIDFQQGAKAASWPTPAKGGKGNILFSLTDLTYPNAPSEVMVCEYTAFDASNYNAGLQPMVQIGKASGAGLGSVTIQEIVVNRRIAA